MDGYQGQRVAVDADAWLGAIFGYPVFRVSLAADGTAAPLPAESIFRGVSPAFYYAKVPTQRVGDVAALTRLGFSVVDVSVTLERRASASLPDEPSRAITVCDCRPEQHDAVLAIAESSFLYSRFHLDPQVPNRVANDVKRSWVDSYSRRRRGDRLLVAEMAGRPVGFLAGLRATVGERRAWVIDLLGVHQECQRRGVGLALVASFVRASDPELVRVGTQAANVPSLVLYERCGFQVADTTYVLHAHV